MKNGLLDQTTEYTIKKGIDKYPAFSWWVPHVLRKKDHIMSKIKTK